ncbi:hypothetical protein RhiJN_20230 [Ceratobasidium sp. AG-Ba]|nr:hypothetical protein RhiJN_20230 [Ceratobasidium sp. AG-Ba]
MCILIIALLILLVTGHLAVANILPLFIILPFLIPSAAIFTRDVVGLYERYKTMNFYQPGYKSLDERYLVACYQIVVEELVLKLQGQLRGWYQRLSQGSIPNSPVSIIIPFSLSRFLLVFWVVYLVGCVFSAALRGLVVEALKLVFYALAATISGLVLVLVFVLVFVSGLVGVCQGMNIGVCDTVAHVALWAFDKRAPSPRICIAYACGVYLAVQFVYEDQLLLFGCTLSGSVVEVLDQDDRSDGCEMYDQEYDWPVDPTLVTPSGHGLGSEADRLPKCRDNVSRLAEKRPHKHVSYGRFGAGIGYVVGFRSEVHSVERCVKLITPSGHNGPSSCARFHPQFTSNPTCNSSTSASYPMESLMIEATSEPPNLAQVEDIHPNLEQHGSASVVSTSPPLSNNSLPELLYDSSASSASSSQTATPVQSSSRVMLYRPVTSRFSSLCLSHKHVGRAQPKFSPLDAPKSVAKARKATGENKAITLLHRSEWKQKAKIRRSRNVVHGTEGLKVDLVDSPMDDVVEIAEPGIVLESVSTQRWIQAELAVDSPFASAPVDMFPRPMSLGSPSEDLDVQEDLVAGEPIGAREIRPMPRLRRCMQAARSNRTDAPLMTNVVCATSLGTPTGSSLPPKGTRLVGSEPLRSDQDELGSGPTSVSSVTPSPLSSIPITTSAAEWIRARRAHKAVAIQPMPTEKLPPNPGSPLNLSSINGLDLLATLATVTHPTTPITEIRVSEACSPTMGPSADNSLACNVSTIPAFQSMPVDIVTSSSNPLDMLASLAAAAELDANVMRPKGLRAITDTQTTRPGIPKIRTVPIYTWLMADGAKRVMKKGEVIPPRAQYTIKDEKGTRMMTVGSKPLKV